MKRFCWVLLAVVSFAGAGCTTTGSTARSDGDRSGVTVFGDIDTGVSRVR